MIHLIPYSFDTLFNCFHDLMNNLAIGYFLNSIFLKPRFLKNFCKQAFPDSVSVLEVGVDNLAGVPRIIIINCN